MFETSIDMMYWAISISILVFTGFLVWIMYFIAQILKQGNEVISEIREKIVEFEEAVQQIRDKVMTSANAITFIAQEVGSVVDIVKAKKTRKAAKRKKK
ncbi:hypothetical protein ACFL2M_00425 [Patescibacteria group bacterium]